MATLQQIRLSKLRRANGDTRPGAAVLSYHRRLSTLLYAVGDSPSGGVSLCTMQRNERGVLVELSAAPWPIPESMLPLVATLPLESMEVFMLLGWNAASERAVLNFFGVAGTIFCGGTVLVQANIGGGAPVVCADFDQNRKDLLIVLDGGRVQSYAIRVVTEGRGDSSKRVIQAIFRRQMQLSKDAGKKPLQIATGDVSGSSLVLTQGGITCIDTGSLDKLWFVSSSTFAVEPVKLWVDKFGSDFVVKCRNARKKIEILEYWSTPTTFSEAEAHSFSRAVLPNESGGLAAAVEIAFEYIGSKHGALLCVLYSNATMQLWRPVPGTGELMLESQIKVIGSMDLSVGDGPGPTAPPGVGMKPPLFRRGMSALPARSFMTFTGSSDTPDCPVCLLAANKGDVCSFAVHTPVSVDGSYTRMLLDLTIAQMTRGDDVYHNDQEASEGSGILSRFRMEPIIQERPAPAGGAPQAALASHAGKRRQEGESGLGLGGLGEEWDGPDTLDGFAGSTEVFSVLPVDMGVLDSSPWPPFSTEEDPEHSHSSTNIKGSLTRSVAGASFKSPVELRLPTIDPLPNYGSMPASPASEFNHSRISSPEEYPAAAVLAVAKAAAATVVVVGGAANGVDSVLGAQSTADSKAAMSDVLDSDDLFEGEASAVAAAALGAENESLGASIDLALPTQSLALANSVLSATATTSQFLFELGPFSAPNPLPGPIQARSSEMQQPARPKALFFAPARLFPSLGLGDEDDPSSSEGVSMLRIVSPSVVVMSYPVQDKKGQMVARSQMSLITRQGFEEPHSGSALSRCLTFDLVATASRAGHLAVVTPLGECFLFNLKNLANGKKIPPMPVEFDTRQNASAFCIVMADVVLVVERAKEPLPKPGKRAKAEPRGGSVAAGEDLSKVTTSFFLLGDSDGKVHFALGSPNKTGPDRCSFIAAHSCPVRAIATTGDACKPAWKVEVLAAATELTPRSAPGSAVVSMGVDGEVKVWQPVFITAGAALPVRADQLFTCVKLEWRLSGLFSARSRAAPGPSGGLGAMTIPITACVDPSCLFLLVGQNDGTLTQWPLPGLVDPPGAGSKSGLSVTQSKLWSLRRHAGTLIEAAVFVSLVDCSCKQINVPRDADASTVDAKSRIVSSFRLPGGDNGGKTIGYTFDDLKERAQASSLCTCGEDKAVVLWRFLVSKDGEDWSTRKGAAARYLYPTPCRRFAFSSQPSKGLCFTPSRPFLVAGSAAQQEVWRLSCIVNGVVVTAVQAPWASAFLADDEIVSDAAFEAAAEKEASASKTQAKGSNDVTLSLMPVLGLVHKPSRTAELLSTRLKPEQAALSWQALTVWMEKPGEPVPAQPKLDEFADNDNLMLAAASSAAAFNATVPVQQSKVHTTTLVVPLGGDVQETDLEGPIERNQEGMMRTQAGGVRVAVQETQLEALEATVNTGRGQPKKKFLLADVPAVGGFAGSLLPPNAFDDAFAPFDPSIHSLQEQQSEQLNFPSLLISNMLSDGTSAPPVHSFVPVNPFDGFSDDVDSRDGRSIRASPGVESHGLDAASRSIEINIDDETKLRLHRSRGGDRERMTTELVLSSPQPSREAAAMMRAQASDALAAVNTAAAATSSVPAQGQVSAPSATMKRDKKKDGEFEVKQTHANELKREAAKKLMERNAALYKSKPKTMYVSKSQKELKGKEPPVRQVLGSSLNIAVPLGFSDEIMRAREGKTVVDHGQSKARKLKKKDAASDGHMQQHQQEREQEQQDDEQEREQDQEQEDGAASATDPEQQQDEAADDWYKDPVQNVAPIPPPPLGASSPVRVNRVGIVLQAGSGAADERGGESLHAVLSTTQQFSYVTDNYFDRSKPEKFIYERKDNARKQRPARRPKSEVGPRSRTASPLMGSRGGDAAGAAADEAEAQTTVETIEQDQEAIALMGGDQETIKALSTEEKQSLIVVLNEFSNAELDSFETLDGDSKRGVLQEILSSEEGVDGEQQARRGVAFMKRSIIKMKAAQKFLAGKVGSKLKGIASMFAGKGALPAADVMINITSFSQKECRLSYLTSNSSARLVAFAVEVDGPYALPTPQELEGISAEALKSIPGVVSCHVFDIKEEGEGAQAEAAALTAQAPAIVLPVVGTEQGSVQDSSQAASAPAATTAMAQAQPTPDEILLTGLEPESNYKVFCYLACSAARRTFRQMLPTDLTDGAIDVNTLQEVLDLEWAVLSDEQKIVEIQAAARSKEVQKKLSFDKASPAIPSDDDLTVNRFDVTSSKGRSAQKVFTKFCNWWAPAEEGFCSKARSEFLLSECIFFCKKHEPETPEASVMATCVEQTILTAEEAQTLAEWAEQVPADWPGLPTRLPGSGIKIFLSPAEKLFKRFRSWYKAGDQLVDYEKKRWEMYCGPAAVPAHILGESGSDDTNLASVGRPGAAAGNPFRGFADEEESATAASPDDVTETRGVPTAAGEIIVDAVPSALDFPFGHAPMTDELNTQEAEGMTAFELAAPGPPDFVSVMPEQRREDRTVSLRQRMEAVSAAEAFTSKLIEQCKQADKKGLGEKDLTLRRAKLSKDDLELIMAAIKVSQLCIDRKLVKPGVKLDSSKLGTKEMRAVDVCGADLFTIIALEGLAPDPPPALTLATLPGTTRRPVRAWQLCSEEERTTELMLASSLHSIVELAVLDGISSPDPEDFSLDATLVPLRAERIARFTTWYAGDELVNKTPGQGIPTLARVTFAEQFEVKALLNDPFVVDTMIEQKMPLPENVLARQKAREELFNRLLEVEKKKEEREDKEFWAKMKAKPEDILRAQGKAGTEGVSSSDSVADSAESEASLPPVSWAAEGEVFSDMETAFSLEIAEDLKVFYENSLASVTGLSLRLNLIRRYIEEIVSCRRKHAIRLWFPPGPARLSHQMLFPPADLMLPPFELPPFRFRPLFLSRNRETAYTHEEMSQWYSARELEEDDHIMLAMEMEGRKRAKYLDWLAKEDERRVQSREDMLGEDRQALRRRAYFNLVEERLRAIDSLAALPRKTDFVLEPPLPGEYGYIKDETVEYEHGSGLHNEDELQDAQQEIERQKEERRKKDEERRQRIEDERRRRQEEEEAAEARREQDRRLAEGMEKRRVLREHLDQVKAKRAAEARDTERLAKESEYSALKQAMAERDAERERRALQAEPAAQARERGLMSIEDFKSREFYIILAETYRMEHEDLQAALRRRLDEKESLEQAARKAFLAEVYAEFKPFEFKRENVLLPSLHSFLSAYPSESDDFREEGRLRLGRSLGLGLTDTLTRSSLQHTHPNTASLESLASGQGLGRGAAGAAEDGFGFGPSFSSPMRGRLSMQPSEEHKASPSHYPYQGTTDFTEDPPNFLTDEFFSDENELGVGDEGRKFSSTKPKSVLAPLLHQPLLWREDDLSRRPAPFSVRGAAEAADLISSAAGAVPMRSKKTKAQSRHGQAGLELEASEPSSAEALQYYLEMWDQVQRRPHTSGSFGLYMDTDSSYKLEQTKAMPSAQRYALPALDRYYARTYTNIEFGEEYKSSEQERGRERASTADGSSKRRRRHHRASGSEAESEAASEAGQEQYGERRPSVEELAQLMRSSVASSHRSPSPPSTSITRDSGNQLEPSLETYLLAVSRRRQRQDLIIPPFRGGARSKNENEESGRKGWDGEEEDDAIEDEEGAGPGAGAGRARADHSVAWVLGTGLEGSTSLMAAQSSIQDDSSNPRLAHLHNPHHHQQQSMESADRGSLESNPNPFVRRDMAAMLRHSAEVADAIKQRHRLELQVQGERQAAASLAVIDRRGNNRMGVKRQPRKEGLFGQGSTGPLQKQAVDAANAITDAYLASKTALRDYVESKSVLEDGYFFAAARATAGSSAVGPDSEAAVASRRELLGLVEESAAAVAATAAATSAEAEADAEPEEKKRGKTQISTAAAGALPVLNFPSKYPSSLPASASQRRPGQRFSAAEKAGLRFTRHPAVPPTPDNPSMKPFGLRGGRYEITEFHPKYGLQPMKDLFALASSASSAGGGGLMSLQTGSVSDSIASHDGPRSRASGAGGSRSRSGSPHKHPLLGGAGRGFADGVEGHSIDTLPSFALSTGEGDDDDDDGRNNAVQDGPRSGHGKSSSSLSRGARGDGQGMVVAGDGRFDAQFSSARGRSPSKRKSGLQPSSMQDDTGTASGSAVYLHTGESGLDEDVDERRASRAGMRGGSRGDGAAWPINDDDHSVGTAASQPSFSPERSAVSRVSITTSVAKDG